jgi:hypothetical protein
MQQLDVLTFVADGIIVLCVPKVTQIALKRAHEVVICTSNQKVLLILFLYDEAILIHRFGNRKFMKSSPMSNMDHTMLACNWSNSP